MSRLHYRADMPAQVRAQLASSVVQTLLAADGPRTVILGGPGGIGKSSLVAAITADIRAAGLDVRWTAATESSVRAPFGAVLDLVGLPVVVPPPANTADLILERAAELSQDRPVLFVVDDAHRADADSLTVLWRLGLAAADLPIRVLLTRRRQPPRELLTLLAMKDHVAEIELSALTRAETAALVADQTGADPSPRLLSALAPAGGSPLHVTALIRSLDQRGRLVRVGATLDVTQDGPLTSVSFLESVSEQLASASDPARELLRVLAVWGRPAPPAELAQLLDTTVLKLSTAVGELVDARLLQWSGEDVGFAHDTIRDVSYDTIEIRTRRMMHRACAQLLATTGNAAELTAYHLERSAGTVDTPTLTGELRHAASVSSPIVAAEMLATAANLPGQDAESATTIAADRAQALLKAGRIEAAAKVAQQALPVAAGPHAAALIRLLILAYSTRGQIADADALIAGVLATGRVPEPARTRLIWHSRWPHILAGEVAGIDRTPATQLTITAETGMAPIAAAAFAAMLDGDGVSAVQWVQRAAQGHAQLAAVNSAELSSIDLWPPIFRQFTYGTADAATYIDHWRQQSANRHDVWVEPYHQFVSATVALSCGRIDDAAAEIDAALESDIESSLGWTSIGIAARCEIDIDRGDLESADRRVRAFRGRGLPNSLGLPVFELVDAEIALSQGQPDRAVTLAIRSWELAPGAGNRLWHLLSAVRTAEIAVVTQRSELLNRIRRRVETFDVSRLPTAGPVADIIAGAVAHDAARMAAAAAELVALGNVREAARAQAVAAVTAADHGTRSTARDLGRTAQEALLAVGATARARGLTARLRDSGVSIGVSGRRGRPKSGWESLTPTEYSIAEMIGAGRTGPDIAKSLFISPRTVQTHVSHSLAKLGLSTRLELAAAIATRRAPRRRTRERV